MNTVNKSEVVGQAVLARFPKYAAKYNVQDISYRAMAGRFKRVAGIDVSPEELFQILTSDDEELTYKLAAKSKRINSWVVRSVGRKAAEYLYGKARQHIVILLELFLLGFIAKKTLVATFKPSKTVLRETGGLALVEWEEVVNEINSIKDRAKRKALAKIAKLPNDNAKLSKKYDVISYLSTVAGLNFIKSGRDIKLLGAPTTVKELRELGRTLSAIKGPITFKRQLDKAVVAIADEAPALYMYVDAEIDYLFQVSIDGTVSIG